MFHWRKPFGLSKTANISCSTLPKLMKYETPMIFGVYISCTGINNSELTMTSKRFPFIHLYESFISINYSQQSFADIDQYGDIFHKEDPL